MKAKLIPNSDVTFSVEREDGRLLDLRHPQHFWAKDKDFAKRGHTSGTVEQCKRAVKAHRHYAVMQKLADQNKEEMDYVRPN